MTTGEVEAVLNGHTGWVTSVAFSQDGSQVVSGSGDKTVRIWNVTTGHSQLITTSDITLPDGSRVEITTSIEFDIFYPSTLNTSTLKISNDHQWIMPSLQVQYSIHSPHCWIPSQYRDLSCRSFWGSRICLGCRSGNMFILDMM